MLLRSATFHNMHWRDFKLDVGELRGLIALVAPNGTGKSSAVEIGILGSCFRKTETQGKLKDRAIDRDAWVEASIVHGAGYTIRQLVDGKTGESLVTNDNGEPVLHDTKVSTYESEFAAKRLPDPEVYLAGPFCAQQSEGFVRMTSAERISVILKVRGIARLERMAKLASERAASASGAFKSLATRITDASAGATSVEAADAALLLAKASAAAADGAVAAAKVELAARQRKAADHTVNKASREAATKHLATLTEQRDAAQARVKAVEEVLASAQAIVASAQAIREAVAQLPAEEAALTDLRAAYAAAEAGIRAELDPWRDGAARIKATEQRLTAARARLRDEEAIRAATVNLPVHLSALEAERAAVAALGKEREALEAKGWADDKQARAALRAGMIEVSELPAYSETEPQALARRHVAADDAAAAAAIAAPKHIADLKARLAREHEHLAMAEQKRVYLEKLAARLPELDAAQIDMKTAEREVAEIRAGHAVAVIVALARSLTRLELAKAGAAKAASLAPVRASAARVASLDAAEARLVELEKQGFTDQTEALRLAAQIAEIEEVDGAADLGEAPDVAGAERLLDGAEAAAREAAAGVTRAEQDLLRAQETAARVATLEAERDAVAAELADWSRIELDLGRKGIQSAEVDAAGPELTELANSLLRKCHGPRFTVEVKTQRLNADGKKTIDECHVRVIDSVKGTDKELRDHSGGERVILGITMRLALSMMACRTADFRDFTFVCDEGGAALDTENNRAFVAMLRHALAATGARHVLLVSHSEEVQRMCDHIIEIPAAA